MRIRFPHENIQFYNPFLRLFKAYFNSIPFIASFSSCDHPCGIYLFSNIYQAIDCFRLAFAFAPWSSKDIALVSLANVFYEGGHLRDAVAALHMASHVCNGIVLY